MSDYINTTISGINILLIITSGINIYIIIYTIYI